MKQDLSSKSFFTIIRAFFTLSIFGLVAANLPLSAQVGPGSALQFDGVNDGVDIGVGKFPAVTNNFTMELWVNPTKGRTNTPQTTSGFNGITNHSYAIFPELGSAAYSHQQETDAGAGISVGTNGISVVEHTASYIPTLLVYDAIITNWTHIAVVYSNKQPSLFVNGIFVATGLTSTKTFIHPSASLGDVGPTGTYGPYKGQIDEVRIWNSILSPSQILTNRQLRLTGAESNLVAYYRLDEGSGTTTADSTTNNRTGTLANGVLWVGSGAPIGGAPIVSTGANSGGIDSTTLNGFVNPNNFSSTAWFEWGLTTNYGNTTTVQSVGSGTNSISFSQVINNLSLTNFYHCRIVASNAWGTSVGSDQLFTARNAPSATTLPASAIKASSATLAGSVFVGGVPSDVWYEWGTNASMSNITSVLPRNGLSFDGIDDFVNAGYNKFSDVSNNFTMEFMVFADAAREVTTQSTYGSSGFANQRYAIFPEYIGSPGVAHGAGVSVGTNGISVFERASGLLASPLVHNGSLSGWNHVAVVYTNRQPLLYVNGTLVANGLISAASVVRPSVNFGEGGFTYGYFKGYLDEVRIWSTPLSQATLQQWMSQEVVTNHPAYSSLVGHWSMNEEVGTLAGDTSSRGNNGALEFGPTWVSGYATDAPTPLNGLSVGTLYYYRLVASNFMGVAYGSTLNFTTTAEPSVLTETVTSISSASATLNGRVNPNGSPTAWQFQWGTSTNYGNATSFLSLGNGTNLLNLSSLLSNVLALDATYHYRIVATNSFGTGYGADATFQTLGLFSPVSTAFPDLVSEDIEWGDYDNDGFLDLLIVARLAVSDLPQLWRNTGNGTFVPVNAGLPQVFAGDAAWGDYDNDGFLDILIAGIHPGGGLFSEIWRNVGNGTFTNINAGLPGISGGSVAWGDYDNDGRLDILLIASQGSQVWRNVGNGTFTNINVFLPAVDFSSGVWGDYDNDGRLDILLTGYINISGANTFSEIYRNVGNGFANSESFPGTYSFYYTSTAAWGDYDSDGFLDVVLTRRADDGIPGEIWRNTGNGSFININAGLPIKSSAAWGDYDNDGRLDLLFGAYSGAQLWRNVGDGTFTNTALALPRGAIAWGDYDNDNRLDFLIGNQLSHNNVVAPNTPPVAPSGLVFSVTGQNMSLAWNPASDDTTPAAGLTYNLRVGTTPDGEEILHPSSDANGKRRLSAMGNVQTGTNAILTSLGTGTYYYSVQAIDNSFVGSPFSTNKLFRIPAAATLNAATNVGIDSVALSGTVLTGPGVVNYQFLYGTDANTTQAAAAFQTVPVGRDFVPVSTTLTGLAPNTLYYARIFVQAAGVGVNYSPTVTFTTWPNTPAIITSATLQTNSQFKILFSGITNAPYSVLVSTNLTSWDVLGSATQMTPGQFEFNDDFVTNHPQRFYRLRNP